MIEFSVKKEKQGGKILYHITEKDALATRYYTWTQEDFGNLIKEVCRTKVT